jgi:hypothetical protein
MLNVTSHLDKPTKYQYLIANAILIPTGECFDIVIDVDYWYHAFTIILDHQWSELSSTYSLVDPGTLHRTLEESLSITTGRCDLAIATHARKIHKNNQYDCQLEYFSWSLSKTSGWTTTKRFLCIFLAWVAMAKSQWLVVMDKLSSSGTFQTPHICDNGLRHIIVMKRHVKISINLHGPSRNLW